MHDWKNNIKKLSSERIDREKGLGSYMKDSGTRYHFLDLTIESFTLDYFHAPWIYMCGDKYMYKCIYIRVDT